MNYIYVDGSAGISGDMMLGALLDLGADVSLFKEKMSTLGLPVKISVKETKRSSLRALKVDVEVMRKEKLTRKWSDIEALIKKSVFSQGIKENSLNIFKTLFKAESKVHGHSFQETHLHEAGADDAIIDIVGTCFLIEKLEISDIFSSPLNLGAGSVNTSHGILPVPPPAVAEILSSIPVYSAVVKEELTTPTGAAIISTMAKKFLSFPELCYKKIGCGAGGRDFPGFPNILRLFYGERKNFSSEKKLFQIETNIDDANPQILAFFLEKAFEMGALDVFFTPIIMKKNRLATKITILTTFEKMNTLVQAVFAETTSIGVRYFPVERRILERSIKKIKVLGEELDVKVSLLKGKEVNIQPEFSVCRKIAEKKQVPVKKIIELAINEYNKIRKN
jgi:uncharacterized protein (TIGR00299 family) protein